MTNLNQRKVDMSENTAPVPFDYTGHIVRTVLIDGEPWFVAADVCAVLGYMHTASALRSLRAAEKGVHRTHTPGGQQELTIISEPGLYRLVMRSNRPEADAFQDWVVVEVLPAIRRTGAYGQLRQLPHTFAEALRELAAEVEAREASDQRAAVAKVRADHAEAICDAIEAGKGLTPTEFHKKYFSDVKEREFFEHLYARKYLIDQRGKGRWDEERQRYREGPEHGHPTAKGKEFFYLHGTVRDGRRFENTRVRPGRPELALKARLIKDGLRANNNDTGQPGLFAIEGDVAS